MLPTNHDALCDHVDVLMKTGRFGCRSEAMQEARRQAAGRPGAAASASRSSGGNAEAQIDALAEQLRRGNSSLSKAQAIDKALREHPELYDQYLREHPAQVGARVSY